MSKIDDFTMVGVFDIVDRMSSLVINMTIIEALQVMSKESKVLQPLK